MFDTIGGGELLLIAFVAFLLFGPKRLPEIGRSLGKGWREVRKLFSGVRRDIENVTRID